MTQAEQQANLDALMQRLYNRLANLSDRELEEDGSSILLNNIGKVKGLIYGLRYEEKEPEDPKPEVAPEATPDAPVTEEAKEAKEAKEEPREAQKAESGDNESQISKADLKKRLIELTNQYDELDVSKIMGNMGYDRLSDIPESRYQELMSSVDRAVEALK